MDLQLIHSVIILVGTVDSETQNLVQGIIIDGHMSESLEWPNQGVERSLAKSYTIKGRCLSVAFVFACVRTCSYVM